LTDFTEKFISGEDVYRGTLLHVRRDVVRLPDGSEGVREYIRHPGAVVVAAELDGGRLVLERQYRYPHGREFIELPAGKVDPGEPTLQTAKRELLEETGYVAAEWRRLGVLHMAIAYTNETIEFWQARGLEKRERRLDAGEFLEVFDLGLDEAVGMVKDGRITDAKTVAGLLWLRAFGR
jgi:ADP-ribose pyrophosphatase